MNAILRLIVVSVFILFGHTAFASKQDPIGWSQVGSLPASSNLSHSYSVSFTLTNNLPFTMPTPLYISNNSTPTSEVTMIDGCTGLKLAPKQTCTVGLVLIPKSVGTKQLSLYMEYGSNKVQIPNPVLTTQTVPDATSSLQGTVTVGFPTSILSNTTYPISFQFTNNSTSPLSNLTLSQGSGTSPGFSLGSSTCSGTLAAGASCVITGSFVTSATTGAVSVQMNLATSTVSGTATTSTIVSSTSTNTVRTITFVNNSSTTLWFGLVGGAVNANPCTTNNDCAQGSLCNPSANSGAGECFYANPVPVNGSYQLAPSASNTVLIPDYGLQYVWSGNMAARTGATCATGTCDTADCASGGGNNGCPVGRGFDQPATLSEFTLQRNTVDSYDVSIINGVNLGNEITPTTNYTFTSNGIPAYNCQSPGNPSAVSSLGLGACNWSTGFSPPAFPSATSATSYVYVKPPTSSPTTCTADSDCTGTPSYPRCGLNFNSTTVTLSKVCGQFLGYVTQDQVCSFANTNLTPGQSNNPGDAFFPCDTSVGNNLASYTYWAMYACKAQANGDLNTCYNTAANPPESTPNCCGCVNWQSEPGVTVPSSTTLCVNTDSSWTSSTAGAQPGVEWLKKACPTVYVYPFDDKASGFACDDINSGRTLNMVNYTITFLQTS